MENEELNSRIIRYLSGECSSAEKKEFEDWIKMSDENRDEFNKQKNAWEKIAEEEIEWGVDKSWNEFAAEHNIPSGTEIIDIKQKPSYLRFGYLVRAAAVLLIMIIGGYYGLKQFGVFTSSIKVETAWNRAITASGEKIMLTLSDNTKIILNADSKLKYPSGFSDKQREVYLEGEAYFEVQHDTSKPFIIHTQNISTTVLGTKFNISAFPEEKGIAVSLVEGKVNVTMGENGSPENAVELLPKQQLVFNKQKKNSIVGEFDYQKTICWKDKNFIFDGETLLTVFSKLERAYGVKFELADKSFSSRKIKINFQNASLWTINESLKKLTGLSYKTITENNEIKKVIFYTKQINNKTGEITR
jgi:transmembrane sensor